MQVRRQATFALPRAVLSGHSPAVHQTSQTPGAALNSDLFRETGGFDFRPGYENRRNNLTMLFGRRGD
ncbi:MAG: hypothetical protein O3B22_17935 [Proteobacteria bacterium]|nr:hypothetical protein [Pseudomonadota bacterium]MDA0951856.1 hypothetical protein [Pseudomonadota bacterium]